MARAGESISCKPSIVSGSWRAPIMYAISWNMELSRFAQPKGSLFGEHASHLHFGGLKRYFHLVAPGEGSEATFSFSFGVQWALSSPGSTSVQLAQSHSISPFRRASTSSGQVSSGAERASTSSTTLC